MKNIPEKRNKKGPKWLTERTLKITEERREAKEVGNRAEVRRLNSEFQREARKDKDMLIKEKCRDLEEKAQKIRPRDMFRTITELTRQFIPKTGAVKGKNGELIMEKEKILERWTDYTPELYKTNEQPEDLNGSTYEKEPWILESEVRWVLDQLPYNKAPGCDNIQIELLKAIKEEVIPAMSILCNEAWEKVK
jgi:hypothetical protein